MVYSFRLKYIFERKSRQALNHLVTPHPKGKKQMHARFLLLLS